MRAGRRRFLPLVRDIGLQLQGKSTLTPIKSAGA
jgi:hypothetical protein